MIKFSLAENQKWPLLLKIAKLIKSTLSLEPLDSYYTVHYEHYISFEMAHVSTHSGIAALPCNSYITYVTLTFK